MSTSRRPRTTVVGLGNPLMGDDAFGLVALERLATRWQIPGDVELVDGGTWGLTLLPVLEDADRVLFLDAVRTGAEAGNVVVLRDDAIPRRLARPLSPHQIDLRELLAVAALRGRLPEATVVIGAEPASLDLGAPLSAGAERALDLVTLLAVQELERWGHRCAPRPQEVGVEACTS